MKKQITSALLFFHFTFSLSAQWISHPTGFAAPYRGLFDISVPDPLTVWAVAYDGTAGIGTHVPEFTRIINGGLSFTTGSFPSFCGWSNICALDSLTAWVSIVKGTNCLDGAILKTTDGGNSWNEQ